MTDLPHDFAAHLDGDVTSVCQCWRLTRRDGRVLGFTDHDRGLTCAGTPFAPRTGLTGSEATGSLGLSVDTVDVEGALFSLDIEEADIEAGLYDGAIVETLLVNWRDPAQFTLLRKAALGKLTRGDNSFVAELESMTRGLDRPNGRTVQRKCDAELGDARCGFDTGAEGFHGSGSVLAATGGGMVEVTGLETFAAKWFANGLLTWTSGPSKGRVERILDHQTAAEATRLTLWREGPVEAGPGDGFTVVAGCDKRFPTCRDKFANGANFRGFPHLPGNDAAYGYVSEDGNFDGGPVVE